MSITFKQRRGLSREQREAIWARTGAMMTWAWRQSGATNDNIQKYIDQFKESEIYLDWPIPQSCTIAQESSISFIPNAEDCADFQLRSTWELQMEKIRTVIWK